MDSRGHKFVCIQACLRNDQLPNQGTFELLCSVTLPAMVQGAWNVQHLKGGEQTAKWKGHDINFAVARVCLSGSPQQTLRAWQILAVGTIGYVKPWGFSSVIFIQYNLIRIQVIKYTVSHNYCNFVKAVVNAMKRVFCFCLKSRRISKQNWISSMMVKRTSFIQTTFRDTTSRINWLQKEVMVPFIQPEFLKALQQMWLCVLQMKSHHQPSQKKETPLTLKLFQKAGLKIVVRAKNGSLLVKKR